MVPRNHVPNFEHIDSYDWRWWEMIGIWSDYFLDLLAGSQLRDAHLRIDLKMMFAKPFTSTRFYGLILMCSHGVVLVRDMSPALSCLSSCVRRYHVKYIQWKIQQIYTNMICSLGILKTMTRWCRGSGSSRRTGTAMDRASGVQAAMFMRLMMRLYSFSKCPTLIPSGKLT